MDLDSNSPVADATHSIPQMNSTAAGNDVRYDTSDLSEVEEQAVIATSPSTSHSPRTQQSESGQQEPENSESESEHQGGSEDGDYDLDDDVPATTFPIDQSSEEDESPRPAKRKLDLDDDQQAMLANPELYGLRRSVRAPNPSFGNAS